MEAAYLESWAAAHLNGVLFFIFLFFFSLGFIRKRFRVHFFATIDMASFLTQPSRFFRSPTIDPALCIGCGNCVEMCPREAPLAIINFKAVLASSKDCIGCGRCQKACPMAAIGFRKNPQYKAFKPVKREVG